MPALETFGKMMMLAGAAILVLGAVVLVLGRFTGIGRLPGDILFQRDHVTVYFPVVTMIIVSLVLTIIVNVVLRLFNR